MQWDGDGGRGDGFPDMALHARVPLSLGILTCPIIFVWLTFTAGVVPGRVTFSEVLERDPLACPLCVANAAAT